MYRYCYIIVTLIFNTYLLRYFLMENKINTLYMGYTIMNRGNLRIEICKLLNNQPYTATQLSKLLKKHQSSISRILLNLSKCKLVKCINKTDDRFRYYTLTHNAKKSLKKIKHVDL